MNEYCQSCGYKGHGGFCCTKVTDLSVVLNHEVILDKINLHFHCGELTAIIGPNGAGKSTLLKALIGVIPHTGTLHYHDALGKRSEKPQLGYVPQEFSFDKEAPVSVLDFMVSCRYHFPVWFHIPRRIKNNIENSLREVKAEHLIYKKLGVLSGGEMQRVLLSLALDPVPAILLLDEPLAGVDQTGSSLFYQIVSDLRKKHDLSILLVSHDLENVRQVADRVVLLDKTVLLCDTPDSVFSSQEYASLFHLHKGIL